MSYFSNPNFMYLQEKGSYSQKVIDNFIVYAYKKGYKKVVYGSKKYVVAKEIERIKKYKKFRMPKNVEEIKKKRLSSYKK